eukprot:TRINITY_DN6858_c0_g1_i5.p1 TRINITY_DN6858_c0_g1~~TRINITY_DN6858_c0_g1_i5.p1  ORF type:complete len:137 (+),score=25.34 TRINITY_DN6858_c0_g1_i5:96-506(+)
MRPQLVSVQELPWSLVQFLKHNDIPLDAYELPNLSRFIRFIQQLFEKIAEITFLFSLLSLLSPSRPIMVERVNPFNPISEEELEKLFREQSVSMEPVLWLPSFYKIPFYAKISSLRPYMEGELTPCDHFNINAISY